MAEYISINLDDLWILIIFVNTNDIENIHWQGNNPDNVIALASVYVSLSLTGWLLYVSLANVSAQLTFFFLACLSHVPEEH